MPKSKAETERLKINAQAQQVLMSSYIKKPQKEIIINPNQSSDVFQPVGEIDYTRFNKKAK